MTHRHVLHIWELPSQSHGGFDHRTAELERLLANMTAALDHCLPDAQGRFAVSYPEQREAMENLIGEARRVLGWYSTTS